MTRREYLEQLNHKILSANPNATISIYESNYGRGLIHEVLLSLSKRLDLNIELYFMYDNEKYKSFIPAGIIINKYINVDNTTNIDRIVEDFVTKLV